MEDSTWGCRTCNHLIPTSEIHQALNGGHYHLQGEDRHFVYPTTHQPLDKIVNDDVIKMNDVLAEQLQELTGLTGQLLTELLIFVNALSEREAKSMNTPAFNALTRIAKLADRIDAASSGGTLTTQSREDSLRERRQWQKLHRIGVVPNSGLFPSSDRDHDGEEAGLDGMGAGGPQGSRLPEGTLYTGENALGEPIVIDRRLEPGWNDDGGQLEQHREVHGD